MYFIPGATPRICETAKYEPSGRAVYGRSPAEIVGSHPTGGMDVCLL